MIVLYFTCSLILLTAVTDSWLMTILTAANFGVAALLMRCVPIPDKEDRA